MSQAEATSKAYEIIAVLIRGFLTETIDFNRDNDRQVLKALDELREHCEQYSKTLQSLCSKDAEGAK